MPSPGVLYLRGFFPPSITNAQQEWFSSLTQPSCSPFHLSLSQHYSTITGKAFSRIGMLPTFKDLLSAKWSSWSSSGINWWKISLDCRFDYWFNNHLSLNHYKSDRFYLLTNFALIQHYWWGHAFAAQPHPAERFGPSIQQLSRFEGAKSFLLLFGSNSAFQLSRITQRCPSTFRRHGGTTKILFNAFWKE